MFSGADFELARRQSLSISAMIGVNDLRFQYLENPLTNLSTQR